ncbi:MAG: response regulator transcription factor, partial [Pyrinomonadaceae bacterium]|nr:response regulator transcription factor [Phycisphaerales bacterium]
DRDGVDVCRSLRRRGIKTPILMLTALSDTADRVAGLNAGADDYLPKPFDFSELCARIRALSRRKDQQESSFLEYGGLRLDLIKRQATREEQVVALSAKEFSLLELFIRNPEKVLPRSTIGEKVWDMNFEPSSNVVDVYISALRKKVDRGFEQPLIHTVVGTGYRFGMPG